MKQQTSGLTYRALIIGGALIPLNAFWVMMGLKWDIAHPSMISLLYNAVSALFLLTVLSRLGKTLSPKLTLSRAELLTVYVMLCLTTAIGGHMFVQMLVPIIGYAFSFATLENDWQALFFRYIPDGLVVKDRAALDDFFRGESTFYTADYIKTWLPPLLLWSAFLFALLLTMLCINFIVRKQWTENEKLSYPLIQLPLAMTDASEGFFENRWMWIGFGIAAFIDLLNGLNYLYPSVPRIGGIRGYDISRFFTTRPWSAIDWLPVGIYPFAVGLAFFIPLDLSFSCWFFYLLWKAQAVVGNLLGLSRGFPYSTEQSFGAYVGLGMTALWVSRKHLSQATRKVFGAESAINDEKEPLTYRSAFLCMSLSLLFLIGFCYKAGMSLWVILIFFALYFAMATGMTRMRAELGSPVHDQHFGGPDRMLYSVFGARQLGPRNLTILSYLYFFNRSYDCLPMPHQLEGLKIAERAGIENRKFAAALIFAAFIGVFFSIWAYLHTAYDFGVYTGFVGHEAFNRLAAWLTTPLKINTPATTAIGVGAALSFALTFMRTRYFWAPFHSAGYAVSSTYTMNFFWFSILFSFIIKGLILKHGGLKIYRRAVPFFLGLILGECAITTLWGALSIILGRSMYVTINL
jgi:hypothetical protein